MKKIFKLFIIFIIIIQISIISYCDDIDIETVDVNAQVISNIAQTQNSIKILVHV